LTRTSRFASAFLIVSSSSTTYLSFAEEQNIKNKEGSRVGEDEEVTWPHSVWFGPFPPPAFIPSTHKSCKEDANFWTSQDGCGFGDGEQIF
jgi:hypothetical protein